MTGRHPAAVIALSACVFAACASHSSPRPDSPRPAEQALPPSGERAYAALSPRFDRRAAMDVVAFMSQYWRLAGNPGFDASLDRIRDLLLAAEFGTEPTATTVGTLRVEPYRAGTPGWDYQRGTLSIVGDGEPVLSRERDRVSLAINSFSTPAGGLRAPLVDVGGGADRDFAGKDVKGGVVLGDLPLGRLWQEAVRKRGAAGVISTAIAGYIRPADPSAMTDEQKDVFQWGSIPYEAALRSFGFKASWRAASRLRAALAKGPVTVSVDIASSFHDGPARTLVAEIPGAVRPAERVVLVAHVQEPGANDNASGCATLLGLARALGEAIRVGALPRPGRTLTFLWLDEIRGSREWLAAHPAEAKQIQYMFSMDMTGEDTARTGGTFLVEKQADPSAVWPRPSDPHSEWGAGEVSAESLNGSLLNDVHLAVTARRSRETGWIVRTNPYEGGSDHTVFAATGIPSLLNWHFTDRFYHTNQDTPDKVSAGEMANVGISVAVSAWLLASADAADADAVLALLSNAATRRLALEREQGATLVAKAASRTEAEATERAVIAAWLKWYGEAFDSVLRLPVRGPTPELTRAVTAARAALK